MAEIEGQANYEIETEALLEDVMQEIQPYDFTMDLPEDESEHADEDPVNHGNEESEDGVQQEEECQTTYEDEEQIATLEMCNIKTIRNDMNWVKLLEGYVLEAKTKYENLDFLWRDFIYIRGFLTDDQTQGYSIIRVKILGCLCKPFQGAHYVQVEDQEPFWIHSLTALRKNFLGYKDFVSFERSAFFALNWYDKETAGPSVLLRLKLIRHLFEIPVLNVPPDTKIYKTKYGYYIHKKTIKNRKLRLTERTVNQVDRILRCMINTLDQEFHDKSQTKAYIKQCIDKL